MATQLSTEEMALLATLGISKQVLDKHLDKKPAKARRSSEAPKEIPLDGQSGTVVLTCNCCGYTSVSYIDYVKRDDGSGGYRCKYVSVPASAPTREHVRTVKSCPRCTNGTLNNFSKTELIMMINNLRRNLS